VLFFVYKGEGKERGLLLKGGWGWRGGEERVGIGGDGRREEGRVGEVRGGEGKKRKTASGQHRHRWGNAYGQDTLCRLPVWSQNYC